jgi:uncharacterized protein (TIGR03118 family)
MHNLDNKYGKFKDCYLTSDRPNIATYQDSNLIAPWGITSIDEYNWIPNYGLVSKYDKNGKLIHHVVLPIIDDIVPFGTGVVYNNTSGFVITSGSNTAASIILVASKGGQIYGYNDLIDPVNAITVIDNSSNNAVYTGITIINNTLCVADYFNNRIDVFDLNFNQIFTLPFQDLEVLNPLPADVAPYNIINIDDYAFVVYARQPDSTGTVPLTNQITYVSIFNKDGLFVKRFINEHYINSWALIKLPKSFKKLRHRYLLSNADGSISIYNSAGNKIGTVRDECSCKLVIYELKGLIVGCNKKIYFTSAPLSSYVNNPISGMHGLFGSLKYICQ